MQKDISIKQRLRLCMQNALFRISITLLLLTFLSILLVDGLLARYTVSSSSSESATVSMVENVALLEHKATFETDLDKVLTNGSIYTLSDEVVTENTYQAVSGTRIPKDPFIVLNGNNDLTCTLYIEVVDHSNGYATFSIDTNYWTITNSEEAMPMHGGTIYRYNYIIQPHETTEITEIIEQNTISIRDDYIDKVDRATYLQNFSIDFYAYLIQNID